MDVDRRGPNAATALASVWDATGSVTDLAARTGGFLGFRHFFSDVSGDGITDIVLADESPGEPLRADPEAVSLADARNASISPRLMSSEARQTSQSTRPLMLELG